MMSALAVAVTTPEEFAFGLGREDSTGFALPPVALTVDRKCT